MEWENILEEKDQRNRIDIILTDVYDEEELYGAVQSYLDDFLKLPFKINLKTSSNFLEFEVKEIEHSIKGVTLAVIEVNGIKLKELLFNLELVDKNSSNFMVIEDYKKIMFGSY